ncbi:uncharacterized protein MONOS_1455 [Monocercomonoides exilis]|uniref:uncharacterized protein n=1 Tax=Monocercomonoides exilis TaxID=2049356 RepID=UPI00355A67D6|nr:hypothetical protein MONOS_1455 [Monocercomonoides exilis]|eukprot:MONOS_1455.1-p1 / transcript=MONOS_1455.1 / gene=MONOS_1455 / organism=Monocercomonoides_exilis_PA203 / gene_product=unspecified product / transcript_product=unspecified product / location=Mono_scaffold00026:26781-26975(+) / protein_length=65 / sequence_SO=supercontig / SO=protein_coding / is_pseudo=false
MENGEDVEVKRDVESREEMCNLGEDGAAVKGTGDFRERRLWERKEEKGAEGNGKGCAAGEKEKE